MTEPSDSAASHHPKRTSRAERQAVAQRQARRQWRITKQETLDALRSLREEQESGLLQSPDLTRAALFMTPRRDEVPEPPRWEGHRDADGTRQERPLWDDESDEAWAWRLQMASREEALRRRRDDARARRRLRPGNVWRNVGSAGERGGPRPGMTAHPPAWTSYLYRVDPEGIGGWGWASPLGRAVKRVERDYAETRLWRALWLATDPRRIWTVAQIAAELRVSERQAYRWLDAAAKRLVAEMAKAAYGMGSQTTRSELREAEASEALAWHVATEENAAARHERSDGSETTTREA